MPSKPILFQAAFTLSGIDNDNQKENPRSRFSRSGSYKTGGYKRGAIFAAVASIFLAACGSAASSASSSAVAATVGSPTSKTLNLAFTADTQPPDPDVFYAGQGLAITNSVYEGLVQYQQVPVNYTGDLTFTPPATRAKIVGDLATSWTVSPNGLTYTFNLVKGVTFHDGTPFTSTAVAASFARRKAVNQGPAYMVSDVTSVNTSNPYVAVVHLKQPESAFLDYLASAYGPKMESPTVLSQHAGKDNAQTWLATHDAGTGPYYISSVTPGQEYVLKSYPKYWGAKPYYTTINIKIIPSISTQELELRSGKITMLLHGLSTSAIASFRSDPSFHVYAVPTLETPMLWVNPNSKLLSSSVVRNALAQAINRAEIVKFIYPGRASVAKQIYPVGELPSNLAVDNPTYNPKALAKVLPSSAASTTLTLGYDAPSPSDAQMAALIQTQLAAAGLHVNVRSYTSTALYGYAGNPAGAPDLLAVTNWPDAQAPDTWARIVMTPTGGLNYLNCSVPTGTSYLNQGLYTTSASTAQSFDAKAGAAFAASGCWDPIANRGDTVVAPTWMKGLVHQVPVPRTLVLADLHP
ncbi:ABC transporter substrate-binding protein [Acidithrix ferrooxidans]|uniref:Putative D,D-dipeptide-binding periplasmic protein DdpA n=1 Tax=Acidithrix ferrooxidans TaxID=1280514 RepID=A0A0D8HH55_9ACTN|nr:ABC transporter substrate-binding protein [Acidithrix ferrooxidans]KJF16386.1 putative D,D-dipeptide-binding periplasmic protein DdpA precursor [Acidithrix ferrooxidans]